MINLVQQLAVYDESGAQIGMTFPKRARQLINKQRALWHDDTHTSIRLLPDSKEDAPMDEYLDDDMDETPGPSGSDDLLLYLAKKNVREKRNLIKHIVVYIAALPLIAAFYEAIISNTRHPLSWQWENRLWPLNEIRGYVPYESMWVLYDVEWAFQSAASILTHPIMYIIAGFMVAWGLWIITRVVNRAIMHRARVHRAKFDPVQLEYQRLKNISSMKS